MHRRSIELDIWCTSTSFILRQWPQHWQRCPHCTQSSTDCITPHRPHPKLCSFWKGVTRDIAPTGGMILRTTTYHSSQTFGRRSTETLWCYRPMSIRHPLLTLLTRISPCQMAGTPSDPTQSHCMPRKQLAAQNILGHQHILRHQICCSCYVRECTALVRCVHYAAASSPRPVRTDG